jgi:hypothetical protein
LPANSPVITSSVPTLPANRPNVGLRNCLKVAFTSAVVWSLGAGNRAGVFTGTMAPESWNTLRPKPLSAQTLRKPPGQRPNCPVSTVSM